MGQPIPSEASRLGSLFLECCRIPLSCHPEESFLDRWKIWCQPRLCKCKNVFERPMKENHTGVDDLHALCFILTLFLGDLDLDLANLNRSAPHRMTLSLAMEITYSLSRFDVDDELLLLQILQAMIVSSKGSKWGPKGKFSYLESKLHFGAFVLYHRVSGRKR